MQLLAELCRHGATPSGIGADILRGMRPEARANADRAAAIRAAVHEARSPDVVLIAGKGHETYQEIAGRRLSSSNLEQANDSLATWRIAA